MSLVQRVRDLMAERKATKPERMRKRAEAKVHRLAMTRSHETDTRGGGGGG